MMPAEYVVIRYIADPARNEPLNVGILAWTGDDHTIKLDEDAIQRVVRDHPRLHRDALLAMEESIRERLALMPGIPASEIRERLAEEPGFPILLSEPRTT